MTGHTVIKFFYCDIKPLRGCFRYLIASEVVATKKKTNKKKRRLGGTSAR